MVDCGVEETLQAAVGMEQNHVVANSLEMLQPFDADQASVRVLFEIQQLEALCPKSRNNGRMYLKSQDGLTTYHNPSFQKTYGDGRGHIP